MALPENHPLGAHDTLTPNLMAGVPLIVMGPDHMTHRRAREAFHNAGVPWRTRVHSHLFKNLLSFVKEGMGAAFLDPFALEFDREGGFVSRPFEPRILMDMAVITSRTRPLSVIGQEFLDLLLTEIGPYAAEGRAA